ncbi:MULTISPECIES: glycosyltransferase family 4 protein [Haloarcula]|uniref:glycosyltransferase family 4 protein n=1 Tax=Haloarcula TaxID=2237 RepID=UPI0023E8EF9C|nr:glycosyltransferase family 4 protein [Halomicroarcula sp. SHR3]
MMVDDFNILLITAHRPSKTADPIKTVNGSRAIVLDNSKPFIKKYICLLINIFKTINSGDYDTIVVNGMNLLGLLVVATGQVTRTPVVVRLGGNIWLRNKKRRRQYWNQKSFRKLAKYVLRSVISSIVQLGAVGYITVSEDLKEKTIRKTGCNKSCVQVVHSPVKPNPYVNESDTNLSLDIEKSKQVILTVTNLKFPAKYEGVMDVIEEIRPLLEEHEDVVYIIAGGGQYLSKIEHYVKSLDINNIHLLGYVDEVEKLYPSCDIFTYVSYNDGYPNVVLEAAAAGLPRVTNDACGLPEQIDNGVDGFLVDINSNPGSLRDSIKYLLDDSERAASIGDAAKSRVETQNNDRQIGADFHCSVKKILTEIQ